MLLFYIGRGCRALPPNLSKLTQLETLNLDSHILDTESISVIGDMVSLKELCLKSCGLNDLPSK